MKAGERQRQEKRRHRSTQTQTKAGKSAGRNRGSDTDREDRWKEGERRFRTCAPTLVRAPDEQLQSFPTTMRNEYAPIKALDPKITGLERKPEDGNFSAPGLYHSSCGVYRAGLQDQNLVCLEKLRQRYPLTVVSLEISFRDVAVDGILSQCRELDYREGESSGLSIPTVRTHV